jgi:hypothetical protein
MGIGNLSAMSSSLPPMPNPTEEQQASAEFDAVWQVIKGWDVNAPEYYDGYCGANGSHVVLLLDAVADFGSPQLEEIWEVMQNWDLKTDPDGQYVHAKQSHAQLVVDALNELNAPS